MQFCKLDIKPYFTKATSMPLEELGYLKTQIKTLVSEETGELRRPGSETRKF